MLELYHRFLMFVFLFFQHSEMIISNIFQISSLIFKELIFFFDKGFSLLIFEFSVFSFNLKV